MAFDADGLIDTLRLLADWPSGSDKKGPARTRVGRFSFRTFVLIVVVTAIAMLVTWLRAADFAAFDQAGLPVASLAVLALALLLATHIIAATIANMIDRRARNAGGQGGSNGPVT